MSGRVSSTLYETNVSASPDDAFCPVMTIVVSAVVSTPGDVDARTELPADAQVMPAVVWVVVLVFVICASILRRGCVVAVKFATIVPEAPEYRRRRVLLLALLVADHVLRMRMVPFDPSD